MFARTESGWARRPRLESGYNERFGAVVDMYLQTALPQWSGLHRCY